MDNVEIIERWLHIAEKSHTFLSSNVRELLDKGFALREINIGAAEIALGIDEPRRLSASLIGDISISLLTRA